VNITIKLHKPPTMRNDLGEWVSDRYPLKIKGHASAPWDEVWKVELKVKRGKWPSGQTYIKATEITLLERAKSPTHELLWSSPIGKFAYSLQPCVGFFVFPDEKGGWLVGQLYEIIQERTAVDEAWEKQAEELGQYLT
jgi:hypothetical protein